MGDLVESMKKAALGAYDASGPVAVLVGTVAQIDPLEIYVDQKMAIKAPMLILARNVTDHVVEMGVSHWTEDETEHTHAIVDTYTGGGSSEATSHRHAYEGRKTFTVHNGLKAGEKVILMREQGGQRFVVLDRLG